MKALIQKLVETPSPSGREEPIRQVIRAEVEAYADEVRVDALGNLIVSKGQATAGGMKVMLAAHVDEIGVIVSHIDEHGFVRFMPIGGVRPLMCLGGRVRFLNGQKGVIAAMPQDDPNKLPGFDQLYIDVGATKKEEVPVRVGDMGVFDRPFSDLGNRLVSKAMDDRIGAAVMIEALHLWKG